MAWFLRLQRILKFPRYSFAPPSPRSRRPRPVGDDFGSDRQADLIRLATTMPLHRPDQVAALRHQLLKNSSQPIEWLSSPSARRNALPLATQIIRYRQSRDLSRTAGPRMPRVPVQPNQSPASFGREHGSDRRGRRPYVPMAITKAALPGYPVNDGAFPALQSNRAQLLPRPLAASFGTRTGNNDSVRVPPPGVGEAALSGQPPSVDFRTDPKGSEDASSIEQQRRQTSFASNAHIDGSALGRWVIQHLERTLAKPTTGMTGVDPRATSPRGRVSPF